MTQTLMVVGRNELDRHRSNLLSSKRTKKWIAEVTMTYCDREQRKTDDSKMNFTPHWKINVNESHPPLSFTLFSTISRSPESRV